VCLQYYNIENIGSLPMVGKYYMFGKIYLGTFDLLMIVTFSEDLYRSMNCTIFSQIFCVIHIQTPYDNRYNIIKVHTNTLL